LGTSGHHRTLRNREFPGFTGFDQQNDASKQKYRIIHENSKDLRGIDNALLFRSDKLKLLSHKSIPIPLEGNAPTRDILYATCLLMNGDTIHFFVNHWPSRIGGKDLTEHKRMLAGQVLKKQTDSLIRLNPKAKLFIMGDFNDEPNDNSLTQALGVNMDSDEKDHGYLFSLSASDFRSGKGTLVYKEIDNTWFLFDQMIVSSSLIEGDGVSCPTENSIFMEDWLLKKGKPYRTYQGPVYLGGFSDHLPIFIDLQFKK